MQPALIDNGKQPDEAPNVRLLFWLPPDTPYGNFQLKLMKLVAITDEANRRLRESFRFWAQAIDATSLSANAYSRHVYANEQAIYLMRRAADELIAMIWCCSKFRKDRIFPTEIAIDSIGIALKRMRDSEMPLISDHLPILTKLNEISNAFKHSFINSDITLIGAQEPCVHALALSYNKISNGAKFHNVSLREIVVEFSQFYRQSLDWLRECSAELK